MSVHAGVRSIAAPERDRERGHRRRLLAGYLTALLIAVSLVAYGFSYYTLDAAHRPLSPKHVWLKPSGAIGVRLGMLGFALFLCIYLYPIRKRWPWLARQGSSRHWLDFHVLLGLTAPVIILFHSSFKFRGVAGMAFWIMCAVALSGLVGRYLYAQIPRSLGAAELSLKELQEEQSRLSQLLSSQNIVSPADLAPLFQLPSQQQVQDMPLGVALLTILDLDLARPFRVAVLRWRAMGAWGRVLSLGGLRRTRNVNLERVIRIASRQARLSKRILFLARSLRIFHLWHVVHRPFSYAFALLASLHILVVLFFGYA